MTRRCGRRRALAAACLGAALLLLGAAPRALRPGECLPGVPDRVGVTAVSSRARAGGMGGALRKTPGPAGARDAVSQGREGDGPGLPASAQGSGERWADEGIRPPGSFASFVSTHLYPVSAAVGGWWHDTPVRMGPSAHHTLHQEGLSPQHPPHGQVWETGSPLCQPCGVPAPWRVLGLDSLQRPRHRDLLAAQAAKGWSCPGRDLS